jgi:hypothetical protein
VTGGKIKYNFFCFGIRVENFAVNYDLCEGIFNIFNDKILGILLIFVKFGKGRFLRFCNILEKENFLNFSTFGKGKFPGFFNFWKRKISWIFQ